MGDTKIQWATKTWNPCSGCTRVSPGCDHCYANAYATRFWGDRKFSQVQTHPERLEEPGRWKTPQTIFVNSMSDLFHPRIGDRFREMVFQTIWANRRHTFVILTKRHDMMLNFTHWHNERHDGCWPENFWLGVTVESNAVSGIRLTALGMGPTANTFACVEPILSQVTLERIATTRGSYFNALTGEGYVAGASEPVQLRPLRWVVVGGESGGSARPCHIEWFRSLVGECARAYVPIYVKQLGRRCRGSAQYVDDKGLTTLWPEDIQVRQLPVGWPAKENAPWRML